MDHSPSTTDSSPVQEGSDFGDPGVGVADPAAPNPCESPAATASRGKQISAWVWVPILYFAEAVPLELVNNVSTVFYKGMGVSIADITLYTGMIYLTWVIKPLWSPFVDVLWTKRSWILAMQVSIALGTLGIALSVHSEAFFVLTLCFFWLLAFASATHDIAADGFYMIGMSAHQQAFFVGIRSTAYRFGIIATRGLLVILAGLMIDASLPVGTAWSRAFMVAAAAYLAIAGYHALVLPRREAPASKTSGKNLGKEIASTIVTFFQKQGVLLGVIYLLFYRLAEAQLAKVAPIFLIDDRSAGGMGLSETDFGVIYGTAGVAMLVLGGILGGLVVAWQGLGRWMLWMAVAINLPNVVYVIMAFMMPTQTWVMTTCVAIEQFGYGFGFAGYMLYMLYLARGPHETAHFAICTGIMAAGMMLPGMVSGAIQEWLGYQWFFVWVMVATLPSFLVTWLVKVDPDFGRKQDESE